jgi:hypothetical protein
LSNGKTSSSTKKLGKSASEAFQMIRQAYGEEALGHSAVFKWHKRYAQGRDSLEDEEHTSRPRAVKTELKIQEVAALVHANCSQTLDEFTAAAGINRGTCHKILSDDLNTSCVTQHSIKIINYSAQCDQNVFVCYIQIHFDHTGWSN